MGVAGQAAQDQGLLLDYTLGSAWPSGGGFAIAPEKALMELTMASTQVDGNTPAPIKIAIPKRTKRLGAMNGFDQRNKDPKVADWRDRLDARAKVIAVVAMKGSAPELIAAENTGGFKLYPWRDVKQAGVLDSSSVLVLTDKLDKDGTLNWTPPTGTWQVFVFKQYAADMGVLGSAGRGPQLVLDHMDPSAFAAHVKRVGDPLGSKPPGIRATFVDSLELMQDLAWTENFLAEFRKRRGYELTPHLPFILQPGWMQAWGEHFSLPYFTTGDSLADRVRNDYRRTVSDLMFDGFLKPLVQWNHSRGLKVKFQAHGGAIDIIRGYGIADIPETEDLVHGGDPLFMRFARSGAHLYGRKIISAESLVWKDRPYDVTPNEMRQRVDLIFSGGVNSLNLHGMNYRFHSETWPGWHAFAPTPFGLGFSTMLNETNPIWPAVKPLATYIGRTQSLLQAGEAVVPIAYFYGRTGYYVGIEDDGKQSQDMEKAFIAGGYDFDRINPDAIAKASIKQGQLVSQGGALYRALVVPPLDAMRAETAQKIASFVHAGLPVFFLDQVPVRDEGLSNAKKRDNQVSRALDSALNNGAKVVAKDDIIKTLNKIGVPSNLHFESASKAGLVFVQRVVEGKTITFIFNRSDKPRDASFSLAGEGAVSRWDAMTGLIRPISAHIKNNRIRVPLALQAGESALLVLDPTDQAQIITEPAFIGQTTLDEKNWSVYVKGYAKRQPFSQHFTTFTLQDWQEFSPLKNFSGEATYHRFITLDPAWLQQGTKLILKLGEVRDIASVTINGKHLPILISAPYQVDITKAAKPGTNKLLIRIANTPQNSMLDPTMSHYKKLKSVPAGLIGPVSIYAERITDPVVGK
ncbi:MAG: hypothetical protein JKY66_04710 [Spongiibacteraceae bacterium]|nr:hypothetical protein [Spongiibacteraceae bacterium]